MCPGCMWFVSRQSLAPLQRLFYEGGSGAGSRGSRWWFPLEGSKMSGAAEKQMGSLNSIATAPLPAASGGPLSCCFHVFIHRNILFCESVRLAIP